MPAALTSALYVGRVMHRRVRPRHHRLAYRVLSLFADLDEIDALDARLRLFSRNRFNLFSLHDRDYGDGSGRALRQQVEQHMEAAGLAPDGGPIRLLTMPRVLGFTFNPLSLYFCHARDGTLRAVLYEVSNTFGERHSYLLPAAPAADGTLRQATDKHFFVSPFMGMDLSYAFRLHPPDAVYRLAITVSDPKGAMLTAVHEASRVPLGDAALMRAFLAVPLVTLKVVAGIYWEAAKIFLKGVPLHKKPAPPATPVSGPV